jgi:hypothetical protein
VSPLSLGQALTLYSWFPLAALLFFLLLIARFYEKFSGEGTFYRLYAIPLILFGAGAVRSASVNRLSGDTLASALIAVGSLTLLVLSILLYARMVFRRGDVGRD